MLEHVPQRRLAAAAVLLGKINGEPVEHLAPGALQSAVQSTSHGGGDGSRRPPCRKSGFNFRLLVCSVIAIGDSPPLRRVKASTRIISLLFTNHQT